MMTIAKDPKIPPKYVYESPDGGKTIRKREFGSSKSIVLREEVIIREERKRRAKQLIEIAKCAETNPTLKDALEKLEMLYLLIKDEDTD